MELIDAIRVANGYAYRDKAGYVCWNKRLGWHAVRVSDYEPGEADRDLIVFGYGTHPLPVTDAGKDAWFSLVRSVVGE